MDVRAFYEQLLQRSLPNGDEVPTNCFCPNHANGVDENNSCSINMGSGLWSCHASNNKGGNIIHAVMHVRQVDYNAAKEIVRKAGIDLSSLQNAKSTKSPNNKGDHTPIEDGIIAAYRRVLANEKLLREFAHKELGWLQSSLDRWEVGYDLGTGRYTIPIRDSQGICRNVRMYDPKAGDAKQKMRSWQEGYGMARLWPASVIDADTIILVEGEKDCIMMNQVLADAGVDDVAAMTVTGGAGVWNDGWSPRFQDKHVVVIFDRDDAGKAGAEKVAGKLLDYAMDVKVVTLDITDIPKADITDFFLLSGRSWDDLQQLIGSTDFFTSQTKRTLPEAPVDEHIYDLDLGAASDEQYLYKKQHIKVLVAGKDLAPYAVPKKVTCHCQMDAPQGKQQGCALSQQGGVLEKQFASNDPTLVRMVGINDKEIEKLLKEECGVKKGCCSSLEVRVDAYHNVEEVILQPEIDFSSEERKHVSRTAYIVQHDVEANKSYNFHGTAMPHPRNQYVVHFSDNLVPAQDNLDDFEMTTERFKQLQVFQPTEGQSIKDKLAQYTRDLTYNVTNIYGREDLILAVALCYHTVLAFDFQGIPVAKAWGDVLILGDTRTGKTETVTALVNHYRLGEIAGGENASFAGLVGGLRQEAGGSSGKRWNIMWGKIPLNDRRLLIIDEASGLALETIGDMSGIRSNGLAEITKIQTERTLARTRLIMLSNPRNSKAMAQYAHGVDAVKELIGRPEDIARFDFVVTAATNEVPMEVIHAQKHDTVEHVYTSELCRLLILWAWSRRKDDIVFEDTAIEYILLRSMEQARKYAASGGVPLVEGGNHRIKIAKLSVAAACMTFSTDTDGEKVIVTKDHVMFAADFLDEVYAKDSLDYLRYSEAVLSRINVSSDKVAAAQDWVRKHGDWAEFFLMNEDVRLDDFKTFFDLETNDAKSKIFKPLYKCMMIERGPNGSYNKSPAFIKVIKEIASTEGLVTGGKANSFDEVDDDNDVF